MALVSKPRGYVEPKPEETSGSRKTVDIFAGNAPTGKAAKLNIEEDAWERIAPPPKGHYSLQLFPGDNPVSINENKKGEFESYSISVMARVVKSTDDYDGAICWPTVTTRIGRGKEVSTAVGLLVKLGYGDALQKNLEKYKGELTDKQVAQLLVMALKKEPIMDNCECDWKASYQDAKGTWVNVATTMDDFPVDAEGNHDHILKITKRDGTRDELQARFFVRTWGGKGSKVEETKETVVEVQEEAKPEPKPNTKTNGKATTVAPIKKAPEPVQEEEEEEEELMLEG